MAERDASKVQLDFPQLTADIIRQLNLTGTLGLLDLNTEVRPVYIVASRAGALTVESTGVVFSSAEVTFGEAVNPGINAVIADTGALPAGTYDIQAQISLNGNNLAATGPARLEHRNAANAATLATLMSVGLAAVLNLDSPWLPLMGYTLALNERLRILSPSVAMVGSMSGTIFARLRPTP